jgi:molybdenum cofactor cytidylyltransferase
MIKMQSDITHSMNSDKPLKIGAVLLAAGEGSRMGAVPKSLLRLQGIPLLLRHLMALREASFDDIVVVTGYHHEQIEAAISDQAVRFVRNTEPQRGQQSSVRLGVAALTSLAALDTGFDVVMVVLADQPLLGVPELAELINAFTQRPTGTGVLYPVVRGQRGNPVVFSGEVIAIMLRSGDEADFRRYIDEHPAVVYRYETPNEHFIIDLDTAEDIAAFEQRTGWALSWSDSST